MTGPNRIKVSVPVQFVPYGPVGHPDAQAFPEFMGSNKDDVWAEFWRALDNGTLKNNFSVLWLVETGSRSLEGQGVQVLPIDEEGFLDITDLPVGLQFRAPAPDAPGRRLRGNPDWTPPRFLRDDTFETWNASEASSRCDHDMGPETFQSVFRAADETVVVTDSPEYASLEIADPDFSRKGSYFHVISCTRCGMTKAFPN